MVRLAGFFLMVVSVLAVAGCSSKDDTSIEDRALISDQLARYSQYWDRKDAEAFSKLFTEDAVLEWHFTAKTDELPPVQGRSAILEYSKTAHEGRLAGRQSRHHFSGLVFEELSNDKALTEHMFMVTHHIPGKEPFVRATGVYRINWQKSEAGWLMSNRKLFVDR